MINAITVCGHILYSMIAMLNYDINIIEKRATVINSDKCHNYLWKWSMIVMLNYDTNIIEKKATVIVMDI